MLDPHPKKNEEEEQQCSETGFEKYVLIVKEDVACPTKMNPPSHGRGSVGVNVEDRAPARSNRSWYETHARGLFQSSRAFFEFCIDTIVQIWRDRPRDARDIYRCVRRNVLTILLVLLSGIITWESSVESLQAQVHVSIVFPFYLPHAVALALASVWKHGILPGSTLGLYAARMYMTWRGSGLTSVNTTIMVLVAILAAMQSHVGAHYLRKCLCTGQEKEIPTIDSVTDAVWYLLVVTLTSFVFCSIISVCIALTPMVIWAEYWSFWGTWWLGVLAAMITVTPLIIHLWAWKCCPSFKRPAKLLECAVTGMVTVGILITIFFFNVQFFRPLPYFCFPLITFTAFRFNRVGWAFTVFVVAFSCATGSIRKRGAMYAMTGRPSPSATSFILQIQLFSIVMGVVSITLAAAVREKKMLTWTLHHMNVELENKVDRRTLELRKANEELQTSQKRAEMASHAKSDFLANMSHEIRTPIHGILGLIALLLESELTVDQKESLASVKECADLLLHIINSVLDLAKIEAGRLEVERVSFNIRKMVSSTFRMLQARAQERGLKLFWEVDRNVPHSLVGDVGKLQQCLLNLVGNALKFTHEGSVSVHVRVASDNLKASLMKAGHSFTAPDGISNRMGVATADKLSADRSTLVHAPENVLIHFEVCDTGIGINPDKLKDMFKPFTQADASTSRLYGGTGLGLCIVHRFVELLGGTIWVESELGKGSTFQFCLPLSLNNPIPKEGSAEASPKVRSPGRVASHKSWTLMGGLMFNHPGSDYSMGAVHPDSEPPSRTSKNVSRVQSANDLAMWKGADSTVISIEDLSMLSDAISKQRENSYSLHNGTCRSPCVQGLTQIDGDGPRPRGALDSDYDAYKESQNAKNHFDHGNSRAHLIQVHEVPNWDCKENDKALSDEVIAPVPKIAQTKGDTLEVLSLQSLDLLPLKTTRPLDGFEMVALYEDPSKLKSPLGDTQAMDTFPCRSQQNPPEGASTTPSDLSRESSTEMEKLLDSKLHLKILLAEDNAINQKVASRQLEKHGHIVRIVGDGQQALDVICAQHDEFDLVLMDVQVRSCFLFER